MHDAEQAALQVGATVGIATLLRGLPMHAAQGCTYIPADVAARPELSLKEIAAKEVASIFALFDKDTSGGLSLTELQAVLANTGLFDPDEVPALFKEFDTDGSNDTVRVEFNQGAQRHSGFARTALTPRPAWV